MNPEMSIDADTALWHPFANMASVKSAQLTITRAEDVWVWDENGRKYLDGTASLWYTNVGHGRREIADAVHAQMVELDAYSIFSDFANPPALELADKLSSLAPLPGGRVFLTSGGGEAIDTAAKIARRYWSEVGRPEREYLLTRTDSYHGTNGYGTSIGGIALNREGWGPLMSETARVPWDSAEMLEAEIERLGADRVAAFFVEPVMGAAGVYPPPPGYMELVAEVCRRHGVLLIVDSVICGFGRLGTWFGIDRWDVEPDMITFAKGVTSGYLPLGGVVVADPVAAPFWEGEGTMFRHGPTYSGHPASCAAALANIALLEADGLVEQGRNLEGTFADALRPLADLDAFEEVRCGTGLLAAVQLSDATLERGITPAVLGEELRRRGLLLRALARELTISPPLTVSEDQIGFIAATLSEAVAGLVDG